MNQESVLQALRATGYCFVDPLTPQETADVKMHFDMCRVFVDAHVPQTARNRHDEVVLRGDPREHASECICVHTDHAIQAPHLFERALELTNVASAYLGRDPAVLYSANAFWTRPGVAPVRDDIQAFHHDSDDKAFLAMFVYLADVLEDEDGPQDLYGPDDVVRTIKGAAGTVFLADTSRKHRGRKPQRHERGLFWYRWGVSDRPPANEWDKITPIAASKMGGRYPADPRLRESIRLLVS